jgi:hypothetical protein
MRVEIAFEHAPTAVHDFIKGLRQKGMLVPLPRSYQEVRADDAWACDRSIDWATAVISLVKI